MLAALQSIWPIDSIARLHSIGPCNLAVPDWTHDWPIWHNPIWPIWHNLQSGQSGMNFNLGTLAVPDWLNWLPIDSISSKVVAPDWLD